MVYHDLNSPLPGSWLGNLKSVTPSPAGASQHEEWLSGDLLTRAKKYGAAGVGIVALVTTGCSIWFYFRARAEDWDVLYGLVGSGHPRGLVSCAL